MVFSIRIVNSDFYIAAPIPDLDVCNSTFRETAIGKVPIIRIYGATPSGQKTCLHVHGVFPYIYVPYDGTQPSDKYMKQLAVSVDFAVQVSLGKASSLRQHVYEISLAKGIPFYGYHEGEQKFLKISLYNPFLVTRVVSLLQNGAVMNKVFQPHEAHIPYLLQFFMDFNLYGMNLLYVSAAKFRNPVRLADGDGEVVTVKSLAETQKVKSPVSFCGTPNQMWNEETVPREWILGPEVERVSFCELEVDVLASDILNKWEIGVNLGTNPGLAAIWEDEQQRRRDANESSQISGPSSQDRGLIQQTETERNFKERIKEIIDERDLLIQSQMGKLGREALSPQELASFQDSICSLAAASQKGLAAADDSLDADVMSQLLSQHVQGTLGEGVAAQSSQVIVDEDEPVVNQSIVQEVVEASQMSVSPELSSTMDKDMINILASLAEESTQPGSQRKASQSIILDTGDSLSDEEAKDDEDLSEAEESIVMSQRVWDDIEHHSLGSGEEQVADELGSGEASQRATQFNLEGMSDTWIGSFLEGDIPQLDGAADESSDGHEEFRKTRKRLGVGRTKTRSSRLINESKKPEVSTRNEIPLTEPLHSEASEKNSDNGESASEMASEYSDTSEEIKRSVSEDVWPEKGRAIRTYSKRTRSSLKVQKSLRLSKEKAQKKKEEEVLEFKTEELEAEKPDREDTFRLFLSESSGSEDNTTEPNSEPGGSELSLSEQNRKLGAEQVKARKLSTVRKVSNALKSNFGLEGETEVVKQKDLSLEVEKSDKIETSAASNERVASYDDFPDITKYTHNPEKKLKGGDKGQKVAKQCLGSSVPSTTLKTLGLLPIKQTVPSTSSSVQTYSCRVALRNRKLSEIEKKELKLGKGKAACENELKSDSVSPLSAISIAMPNLRVSLEDVSQSQMLDSKFSEACARLRRNRETPHQSYTVIVNQVLKSPVAKERPSLKRSPVVTRTKERVLSLKRTSPKRKEERMKQYGTLPVVIAKSPKKSSADNSQVSQASPANRQIGADTLTSTSQIYDEPAVLTDVFSSVQKGGDDISESASSRSHTLGSVDNNDEHVQRFMEYSSSETPVTSVSCSGGDGKISRHRTGSVPSRQVSLKLTSRSGDTRRTLSLERKGLKRKLKVDFHGQQTPVRDLLGSGKKRKLSLTLKVSSISFPRMDDVSETRVASDKEYVVKEGKSVFKDQDNPSSFLQIQQARVDAVSDDGGSGFDVKKEFAVDRSLLNEVTCVPSSPGEPNSGDEVSPKCSKSSLAVTGSDSLPGLTEAYPSNSKPPDNLNSDSFAKMGLKTTVNVANDVELASQKFDFPNEKETELLANALFNMSFPSPLHCVEECCSPPCPSSPLKANCHDWKGNQVLTVNSSCAEEGSALEVEEANESPEFSYLDQVQESQSSPVVHSLLEGYAVVPPGLQLGETQSHGENTETEITNYVGQKISEKDTTSHEESLKPLRIPINKSDLRSNGEEVFERKGAIGGGEDNSEFSISVNNYCKSEIVAGSESSLSPGLMARDSVIMPPVDTEMTDLPDLIEAEEPSKLSLEEENSIDAQQLSAQSNSDNKEMEMFLGEGEEEQVEKTSSRIPSAEKNDFVFKLSLEEENSYEEQPLSAPGNADDNEMEISSGEGKETQVEKTSSKQLTSPLAAKIPTESFRDCKEQTLSKVLSVSAGLSDDGSCKSRVVIKPLKKPPSSEELLSSLTKYGLPHCKYQEPFCSNPDDIPALPREVGGRILRIESKEVSNLPEFESSSSSQGLKHWRTVMSSARKFAVRNICQTMEDAASMCKNAELKIALMGDGDVVTTPCRGPPSLEAVKAWARSKLAKRSIEAHKKVGDKTLKKQEQIKEPPKDLKLVNVEEELVSEHKESDVKAFNVSTTEQGPVTLSPSAPIETLPEVTSKVNSQPVQGPFVRAEVDKQNVVKLSDSFSPVEITSPCGLFSPNEGKMFTFASGTHPEMEIRKSHDKGEKLGTQPMDMKCRDPETQLEKVDVTSGASSVTVTPSIFRSPEQTPSSTQQPLSPLLQTQNAVFSGPHHSTPVATKLVYGVQSPRCTPISNATIQKKRLDANVETSGKKTASNQASTDQTPSLRQQLLASQFKFVTPGSLPRRAMPWSSQIEGPSPNNTYGFKVPQMNLLHEVQHLTLFSLELHVRTRRDVRPDPEFDPICAIFYYIQTDTPLPSGKNKVTGILCVDSESAKVYAPGRDTKEKSLYNEQDTFKRSPHKDAVASTSTSNASMSRASQNTSILHSRTLVSRSGVTDYDVQYVAEEKDLFPALLLIIRKWDPDILIGYEVQMLSWGFLLERALAFEIDLCSRLARVQGSSSDSNMDAEKDRWGAAHTSEIKIAGRIILNVWRLMRHEVTLSSYSFENIAFHVLHERIPLFTFRTLSDWWDQRTALNRWRTIDHYVRRCRGNVRILEAVDFIGRTSELARLFGILFFSVISRGSQYRVESMMLRIAKPMNYIPVSPSVEQRGAMRAPETIPLVMEPESRFYSDPVLVLDFQSLYPTMIIAYNYCFSTCLGRVSCLSEYGEFKFGATSLCVPPSLLKKLEGDIHVSPNGVAYVKPSVRRGILPSMLDEILQTRIMVKTSMKKWKSDKSLGRMLDARQLGLKLIANVTFGYTSAHFSGRMPCVEIGDSIVRKARETLERAIDLVNNTPRWGARVVYGDTDSLFVLLKGATKEQAFSIGKDIVDTVTAMNPKPVKLKFEKVYLPCVLQTKKRYVGYMYETLDQKEPVFDAKGIETVRRDSCPAVAKILEKSLRTLFETRDLSLVKKYVQRQCSKLMEGRASVQDFTFAKEYRGMKSYKPGACVPALELTRRMLREDRRSEPRVGERVPYVVVYGSPGLPLIQLVRRPHEVLQDPGLRLNASYYITKQILPPLNRVFSLIGMDVFTWYAELPRVVRVAQMPPVSGDKKKGTISQYFSTMTCPVCQELTPTDLCNKCRAKPQMSAVTLMNRMRGWERTHQHLSEICYSCSGSRDSKLCCVSLDCPVFYKLVQCTRDLKSSQHLRKILESF